jgi:hypothetical protein
MLPSRRRRRSLCRRPATAVTPLQVHRRTRALRRPSPPSPVTGAVSLRVSQLLRRRFRHRRPISGQADTAGDSLVSLRSGWASSPPPWCRPVAPLWPTSLQARHGLPSSWPAWPGRVGLGPQRSVTVGQQTLGTKCPATYFLF